MTLYLLILKYRWGILGTTDVVIKCHNDTLVSSGRLRLFENISFAYSESDATVRVLVRLEFLFA